MASQNRPIIFIATLSVAAVSLALFFLALVNGWFGEPRGVGDVFCEASSPNLIKQPSNTWSNIGFVLVGLFMALYLSRGQFTNNNSMAQSVFYGTFFCCLAVLLGPGSMAMHATLTPWGGFFDMLSMYLVASFTTAYGAQRFFGLKQWQYTLVFVSVMIVCLIANFSGIHFIFDFMGNTAFAFFIALTTVLEMGNIYIRKLQIKVRWAFASFGCLIVAFIIWNLSYTGMRYCDPQSMVQGHAMWHLLCAGSVWYLFSYYVSEDAPVAV